ncbi:hypothetical protein [Pyrobaculum aerophilum]|uniref:Uncharacterized protein n=1 Tax=Pyrobaculum aerophilum TaxID=13773 RepID=A0A832T2Z3_9CREN|nr:hypothetical protein [Pyrobaculum aerophilum]HII46714.1 hypothetical protein [Pyrobaculum aerophilum]
MFREIAKARGLALVAEPDPKKATAYVAALRLIGAVHLIQKEHLYTYLASAGLVQVGKEVDVAPYTISLWREPQKIKLSPGDTWME